MLLSIRQHDGSIQHRQQHDGDRQPARHPTPHLPLNFLHFRTNRRIFARRDSCKQNNGVMRQQNNFQNHSTTAARRRRAIYNNPPQLQSTYIFCATRMPSLTRQETKRFVYNFLLSLHSSTASTNKISTTTTMSFNNDYSESASSFSTLDSPVPSVQGGDDARSCDDSVGSLEVETFWEGDEPPDVVAVLPTETFASDYDSDEEDADLLQALLEQTVEDSTIDGTTNTYEIEDVDCPDTSYWLWREQVADLRVPKDARFSIPKPMDWYPLEGEDAEFHISVDRSRRELWDQCKREVETFKSNVLSTPGIKAFLPEGIVTKKKQELGIYSFLLGPKSELGSKIQEVCSMTQEDYCKFIYTFFLSCQFQMSVAALCKNESVNKTMMLDNDVYNDYWRVLDIAGKITTGERVNPIWMDIERIFNEAARLLFMSDDPEFMYILALDDDKVHFEWKRTTDTTGLKRMRHTKANARGFVVHTAGHAASGAPIQIGWMRDGDTEGSVYQRIMGHLFGTASGTNNRPEILNSTLCSDRGYWTVDLLFNYALPSGAHIGGTVKRLDWLPFTYQRENSKLPDKPENLSLAGYKNAYLKQTDIKISSNQQRKLQVCAYRSGTGTSMSLILSTRNFGNYWDFQTLHPRDSARYHSDLSQEERNQDGFPLTHPADFETEKYERLVRKITETAQARTQAQCSADWFLDRMFSLTSSQFSTVLRKTAKKITPAHPLREAFESLLSYAQLVRLLPNDNPPQAPATNEGEADDAGDTVTRDTAEDLNSVEDPQGLSNEGMARTWMRRLASWDSDSPNVGLLCQKIDNGGLLFSPVMKAMIELVPGGKVVRSATANKTKLKKWVKTDPTMRPFLFLTKKDLVEHALFQTTGLRPTDSVEEIRNALAEKQAYVLRGEEIVITPGPTNPANEDCDPVLLSILKTSFLKKESAKDKHDARLVGQINEPKLLRSFFEKANGGSFHSINIECILQPGLVAQRDRPYLKASADAIIGFSTSDADNDFDGIDYMPAEIKTIVSIEKQQKFEQLLLRNIGANTYRNNRTYFRECQGQDLKKWIPDPNWLLQTLHQAATMQKGRSLFLLGTRRRLWLALIVRFQPSLFEAYDKVVEWIYEHSLSMFYNPNNLGEEAMSKITRCLESDTMKKAGVDVPSFRTNYGIWRRLNVNVQRDIYFPLPRCTRCLPYVNSNWNCTKSPSDTTTKLLDSCDEHLGIRTPHTVATARELMLFQVLFHRAAQMISAKDDLSRFYHTLAHFRNAASHRQTYEGSMEKTKVYSRLAIGELEREHLVRGEGFPTSTERRSVRGQVYTTSNMTQRIAFGLTPQKGKPEGECPELKKAREECCLGIGLVNRVAVDEMTGEVKKELRPECALCYQRSPFFCSSCSRYFCVSKDRLVDLQKRDIIEQNDKITTIKFERYNQQKDQMQHVWARRSCYFIAHQDAWQRYWDAVNAGVDTKTSSTEYIKRLAEVQCWPTKNSTSAPAPPRNIHFTFDGE